MSRKRVQSVLPIRTHHERERLLAFHRFYGTQLYRVQLDDRRGLASGDRCGSLGEGVPDEQQAPSWPGWPSYPGKPPSIIKPAVAPVHGMDKEIWWDTLSVFFFRVLLT